MGVDLGDLVPAAPRRLTDFKGKIVAIDAYNTLYQFLSIIRQPDGTPLKDAQGRVTSHLAGLLYRTANLAEAGVRPVYVFDGAPSPLKFRTLDERRARKEQATREYEEAKAAGDTARAFSKAQQTSRLGSEMIGQAQRLLDGLGVPWLRAPGEGEAQAAHMAAKGDVWAASSQDFDALLLGAPLLVRNLTVTGRRKLPGKSVWVDVEPELIELGPGLQSLGLSREQLVDVGILVGTDFNDGVKGVGPKRALKLVKEHGTLERVLAHLKADVEAKDEVRGLFLHPAVTDDYSLKFGTVDEEAVVDILVREHGFSKDRVTATFPRYRQLGEVLKQRSLDAFF